MNETTLNLNLNIFRFHHRRSRDFRGQLVCRRVATYWYNLWAWGCRPLWRCTAGPSSIIWLQPADSTAWKACCLVITLALTCSGMAYASCRRGTGSSAFLHHPSMLHATLPMARIRAHRTSPSTRSSFAFAICRRNRFCWRRTRGRERVACAKMKRVGSISRPARSNWLGSSRDSDVLLVDAGGVSSHGCRDARCRLGPCVAYSRLRVVYSLP